MRWWRWTNGVIYGIAMLGILNFIDGGKKDIGVLGGIIAGVLVTLAMYASDWIWDRGHQVKLTGVVTETDPPLPPAEMARHFAAALADNAVLSKQVQQLRALATLAMQAADKLCEGGHRPWCKAAALTAEKKPWKFADCDCGAAQYSVVLQVAKDLAAEHLDDYKKKGIDVADRIQRNTQPGGKDLKQEEKRRG